MLFISLLRISSRRDPDAPEHDKCRTQPNTPSGEAVIIKYPAS